MLRSPLLCSYLRFRLSLPCGCVVDGKHCGAEFVFLVGQLTVVFAGVAGVIWNWYDTDMDLQHAKNVEFAEFGRLLHKDPAFRNIESLLSG